MVIMTDILVVEDNKELAGLLKQIILADIELVYFKEKEGNLEEIFMQVTGGEQK